MPIPPGRQHVPCSGSPCTVCGHTEHLGEEFHGKPPRCFLCDRGTRCIEGTWEDTPHPVCSAPAARGEWRQIEGRFRFVCGDCSRCLTALASGTHYELEEALKEVAYELHYEAGLHPFDVGDACAADQALGRAAEETRRALRLLGVMA